MVTGPKFGECMLSKTNLSMAEGNSKKKALIVGGGTAGIVILNDLRSHFDISILEQSQYRRIPFYYRLPLSVGLLFSGRNKYVKKFNFYYLDERPIPFFQSNCLGGASVMNGSVHVVGSIKTWGKLFARFSLNLVNLFDFYDSVFSKNNEKSKIRLKEQCPDELDEAFYKSMEVDSVCRSGSEFFDSPSCGPIWNAVKSCYRSSVLDLMQDKMGLVRLSTGVDDIEIVDGAVKGVWVRNQFIKADIVILSAGVLGTVKLLSRILEKLNVDDSQKKIKGIKDHTNVRINVKTKKRIFSINQIALPFLKRIFFILGNRKAIFSIIRGSGASSAANIDLYGNGEISLRVNLLRFHESGRLGSSGRLFDNCDTGFSLSLTQINPFSEGFVDENGSANPCYLSAPEDIQFLKDALHHTISLLQTPPLNNYVDEIIDLDEILGDPESYIKKNFYSGYHLIGGAADLIDSDFKIKGVDGLYVCDASILSEYPSSNIHSSVIFLAKAFSKKLIDKIESDKDARF